MLLSVVLVAACGGDDSADDGGGGGGVAGLWAWCDDEACSTLDDGGLLFGSGRVLDAWYDAEESLYCTYEDLGTYEVDGTTVVISAGDGSGDDETYTLDGSFLRGSYHLKRVQATAAARADCPN